MMGHLQFVSVVCFIGIVAAGIRSRRDNTYGDELVTPAGGGVTPLLVSEVVAATVASQGGGAQTSVETSGYRKKRHTQNTYGDEASVPVGGGAETQTVMTVENPVVTIEQTGGSQSSVHSSGY